MRNKRPSKKDKTAKNDKWKLAISILTVIISLATFVVTLLVFINAQYDKNIEYDKEDNLYIIRSVKYTDGKTLVSNYIYSLCSSEDISNYSNITIHPLLHIYIKDGSENIIDSIFITLPDLYELCPPESTTSLLSFKDFIYPEIFSDSIFRGFTKYYNTKTNDIYMDSDIIYRIQYRYNSKRNKFLEKEIMISRNYDFLNGVERTNLFVDSNLPVKYEQAIQNNHVYKLDALKKFNRIGISSMESCFESPEENLLKEMLDECLKYIDDFQMKYNLSDFIEKQNESKK